MKLEQRVRVPPEQLRWTLLPADLGFASTDEVRPGSFVPGQHRALRALEIGLALRGHGYNVFVAGEPGTSRTETVRHFLHEFQDPTYVPEDLCYVFNFRDPDQPRLLRFPAGQGRKFRDALLAAIARLQDGIPRIFQSEVYSKRRRARMKRYASRMEQLAAALRRDAEPAGLVLVQVEIGEHAEADLLPLIDNEPMAFEDLEAMVEEDKFPREDLQRLIASRAGLEEPLRKFRDAANRLVREAESELADLDRQMTHPYLNLVLSGVYRGFEDVAGVTDYLREIEIFLEARMALFHHDGDEEAEPEPEDEETRGELRKLQVNLILDHGDMRSRPVVFENNPNVPNLRGSIDREIRSNGMVVQDFTHIKAGSMIRAHGGFLVIHADDLEGEGRPWQMIKRALRTSQVQVESGEGEHQGAPRTLRPQPVIIDTKVILVGTGELYQTLLDSDDDFPKIFKVKAEFDTEMELGPQAITEYACLVRSVCDEDELPAFRAEGVAAVIEHGVRLAGQRNRITTRFSQIADLVREAAFWAGREHNHDIGARDVWRALEERRNRVNLAEEKTQRLIREGVVLIDTNSHTVGQVNGLAVLDVGDHQFGRPTRITTSISAGLSGVLNIERLAALSGRHHDKGVLILTGYLRETFALRCPLAMTASVTLEQSYDEVDGDSAATAEILSLLSALSGVPARQDMAVTGSMNQKGQVQAVGGVNEKIEGFYDLCLARGLTGNQGVIIPAANIPHLMLRPQIVEAVRERRFHIFAVSRVEEAAELLMGVSVGDPGSEGRYAPDTLFGKVQRRLQELADAARDYMPWTS
ncbi:MAG TPA: AAA family ATPase [Candidatus Eisenbacteria bacterium]|nr:AAA family ATPase [Candidatus Eisenbacteria bacterium]